MFCKESRGSLFFITWNGMPPSKYSLNFPKNLKKSIWKLPNTRAVVDRIYMFNSKTPCKCCQEAKTTNKDATNLFIPPLYLLCSSLLPNPIPHPPLNEPNEPHPPLSPTLVFCFPHFKLEERVISLSLQSSPSLQQVLLTILVKSTSQLRTTCSFSTPPFSFSSLKLFFPTTSQKKSVKTVS